MNLNFRKDLVAEYHSKSQWARVSTEDWMEQNMFCPRCGNPKIKHFSNNKPVADFFCPKCATQYELKSKKGKMAGKVNDGAYKTMIERITSRENPNFFFMSYSMNKFSVENLIFVPKYFFIPDIIQKRKPLASTARRAGWIGCNILLDKIPEQERISIIQEGHVKCLTFVVEQVKKVQNLSLDNIVKRGWLLDILNCINEIQSEKFELADLYHFEKLLAEKHPNNNYIHSKIRQQLQLLRDKGVIEFMGNGIYKKCF